MVHSSESRETRAPVRYAVIGAGWIAQAAVLPSFANAKNAQLVALISGDPDKRIALAERHQIPFAAGYDDFEQVLETARVDAVYIALPNTMHRSFTERAARAGVHVLCEKPMATTEPDCEAMIETTRRAGRKLMIAYRLHFDPANLLAVQTASSGALGDLRYFESSCSQITDEGIRLDPHLGGGALFDAGIYCLNAARYLFRDEPIEVLGMHAEPDVRFEAVDETMSALLRFPGGRLASFTCSLGAAKVSSYRLVGTRGELVAEPAYGFEAPIALTTTIDGRSQRETFPLGDQFAPEIEYFASCIREDREPEPSGEEGLADVRVLTAIKEAAATGVAIRLQPFKRSARPTVQQGMRRPPVARQTLVHAASASK
jgi:predicted dehydrogenase